MTTEPPSALSLAGAMLGAVPLWSTRRAGDPTSIGHLMVGDGYGRATSPACGVSSEGLFYRRDHDWGDVPER